jgi:hypothetical protein
MPTTSLIPAKDAGDEVVEALQTLLDEAKDAVLIEHGGVHKGGTVLEAEITHKMISLSENHRSVQRAAQGYVVAYVSRNQLWLQHPDEYAAQDLRCFLRSTGMGDSTVSDLVALGDKIVPFCDHHKLPIDTALTPDNWPKLRETIPAMRQAVKEDDAKTAKAILADVRKAVNRDAVRVKYRTRREHIGQAMMNDLPDDRVLLVAVLDDPDAAKVIALALGGKLEWKLLTAKPKITKNRVTVEVMLDGDHQ